MAGGMDKAALHFGTSCSSVTLLIEVYFDFFLCFQYGIIRREAFPYSK
jgi:hypothetical protein